MDLENVDPNNRFAPQWPDVVKCPDWLKQQVFALFPCKFEPLLVYGPDNGLKMAWQDVSFAMPPANECHSWVRKAVKEQAKGNFSILLVPATFNAVYWREDVYSNVSEIRILTCPLKLPSSKRTKAVIAQMALLVFAAKDPNEDYSKLTVPITIWEPTGWASNYYKKDNNECLG